MQLNFKSLNLSKIKSYKKMPPFDLLNCIDIKPTKTSFLNKFTTASRFTHFYIFITKIDFFRLY